MKQKIQFLLLAVIFAGAFAFNNADAQVTISGSTGVDGTYGSLTLGGGAFDILNGAESQAGNNIIIDITADLTTESGVIVLNEKDWATLTIRPSGGAARTVYGTVTGGALISLNGADNVIIDGLNTGGNSLTIANLSTSNTTGKSTIKLEKDASNNTITRCSVLGSSSMGATTNGGNIYFSASAVTTGSDNNTVSNCDIGPAGGNLPTKGIYSNGTTTTVTTYNSGIVISGNRIFDYFGAAVQSAGIYVSGGNTDWTIQNNKLYQSSARTQTTGTIHAGIQLASANINNCTISGNTVGFANSSGTGTYGFVGVSSSSRFYPIYISVHGATTGSSVTGNTIAGISVSGLVSGTSTSAPFAGILVATTTTVISGINNNTIGSSTVAGSITYSSTGTTTGEVYGIYFFPSTAASISNNSVGGISVTNTSTGSAILYGIRAFTASTVTNTMNNNIVGYSAAPLTVSATGTSSRIVGIYSQSGTSLLNGNTVSYLSINSPNVATGTSSSAIGIWSDNTSASATGNNISQNLVSAIENTNATAAVWVSGLVYGGSTTGTHVVQRNFIQSLNMVSSSATATMNGIYIVAGLTTYQNNMVRIGIDALGNPVTAGVAMNGISEQVAGIDNIYFNSVYVGGTGVGGSANSYAFVSTITTNTRNFRNNIFFNARSNGAGTGKHYAVRVGGTAPNPAGLTINNNNYFTTGSGGTFGFFNSLDVANLAAWQTAVGQDAGSFFSDPQFINPNGSKTSSLPVNLHINPSIPTKVEGNGFDVTSITNDYDGETRSGLTPVDIGADAGNFTSAGDITPPSISYTALLNTSSTSNRNLSNVVITDASGVNGTLGTRPRIYYKKSTDANTWVDNTSGTTGWKYAEASGSTSPFDFTINYSLLFGGGGVTGGDVIQYFVIAQDVAVPVNVGINAGSFTTMPVSVALTAAAFPVNGTNSYIIVGAPLSGDYTIGVAALNRALGKNITFERVVKKVMKEVPVIENKTVYNKDKKVNESSPDGILYNSEAKKEMREVEEVTFVPMENGREYTGPLYVKRNENPELESDFGTGVYGTITAAVNDLNLRGSSGAVRFLLLDANYPSESFPIIIGNATASSVNTLTIQPASGVTSVISGSSTTGIFVISSPYTTIQGDNVGGSVGRDLTITNTLDATGAYVVGLFNYGAPLIPSNSSIRNCNISAGATATTNNIWGIILNALGGDFDNIVIDNNLITKAKTGIQFAGVTGFTSDNGQITNNIIGSLTAGSSIYLQGIVVSFADNLLINKNELIGLATGNTNGAANPTTVNAGVVLINSSTNTKITKNYIHDYYYSGTTGYGAFGVVYGPGATTNTGTTEISNNMIYNIKGDGDSEGSLVTNMGYLPQGICVFNNGTAGVNIYDNSIYLSGAYLGLSFNGSSACIGVANTVGAGSVNIRNNALQNSMTTISTGVGETMAIWVAGSSSSNTIFADINYNDYYVNGQFPKIGYLNTFSTTLADWKTATGKDLNSISENPQFTGTTNLHVLLTTNSALNNNGVSIAGITDDIDGNTRVHAWAPDIGADEFQGSYVLDLKAALQNCTSGNIEVTVFDGSCGMLGSPVNVALTGSGPVDVVFTGINDASSFGSIRVKETNSLEIWSSSATPLTNSKGSYYFTTAQSQESGGNLIFNGTDWAMISGDVNQDQAIDASDLSAVENDQPCGDPGCQSGLPTDLTCDDYCDASDLAVVENNQGYYASSNCGPAPKRTVKVNTADRKTINTNINTDSKVKDADKSN